MYLYDSIDQLYQQVINQSNQHGFDKWVLVGLSHTSDSEYSQIVSAGKDKLGYQPCLLTFADPLNRQHIEIVLKNINDSSFTKLKEQLTNRYHDQFEKRHGLFAPAKNRVDAIYSSYNDYENEWIQSGDKYRLRFNIPVLLDHVSDAQYWAWSQKDYDPAGTQRLIISVFQPRTTRFADILIKDVDDLEMNRIKLLLSSKTKIDAERIF